MQVEALTVEQAFNAKTPLHVGQCLRLALPGCSRSRPPTQRIGAIDQGECGKNRASLAVCEVDAWNSAPLDGIVHARQIVEDQRRRVEVFERDGQVFGGSLIQAVRRRHLKDHLRPDEAARIVEYMTQRFLEGRVEEGGQRKAGSECIRERRCIQYFLTWRQGHVVLISLRLLTRFPPKWKA